METVTLKSGAVEAKPAVMATMMSLKHLFESEPIVAYELVMKCRDRNHQFFGNTVDKLKQLSLVQPDGNVHDTIRNIVVSAAQGDGLDMSLGSPIKQ
ncbi:MAG: hypothetical protein WEC84_02580 [Candidatus Andersenbacteria bacterium]